MRRRRAFTLVELLVVIAIIGVLVALIMPAVQAARESSRRTACINNLHNHVLALTSYHAAQSRLPLGRYAGAETLPPPLDWSWAALVLPYLENVPLASRIDYKLPCTAPANLPAIEVPLALFRCPSGMLDFPGDTDYAGVLGTAMNTIPNAPSQPDEPIFNRGVLISRNQLKDGVSFRQVTDGLSYTLAVVECVDVEPDDGGVWASGASCISHDTGRVNEDPQGISSLHPGGALGARADGSAGLLSEDADPLILGALCTRDSQD
jgi:prepilin-type N-terminal cleavage/methylation domain-containing protein